ncbi:MAG TPA: xanthine dehydrogenase family protein subunit M [Atribacterota bacterium]|nr:xanthine dehydrogenase family protein subunit M [Atribacterota bacterium]
MHTNTRILANKFEYLDPKSLSEALNILDEYQKKNIKILAGGTDLLVKMKTIELNIDYLLYIKEIAELNFINTSNGLSIGATIPFSHIIKEDKIKTEYTALYEAIQAIAAPAIRNMGTVAGNIGNASPAADTVPALIVFDAQVLIESKQSKRTLFLKDLFLGPGKTVLRNDELITRIEVPEVKPNTGSAFIKKSRVKADLAKINLAVAVQRKGQNCENCKIAFGSVAATVVRAENTEKLLEGKALTEELISKAAQGVADEIKPIDDIRSTAEYRIAMSREMLQDALSLAWARTYSEAKPNLKGGGE